MGVTCKFYDPDSDLTYYGFRWLDQKRGRWMSEEPLGLDRPNLYVFNFNDPVNYYDVFGLEAKQCPEEDSLGDKIHFSLDMIGIFDPIGVADGLNALFYAGQGDWGNAVLSALSLIPFGDISKAVKFGNLASDAARYDDYWKQLSKRAPEKSTPYDIRRKYDESGYITGATTYDEYGNRTRQYEFGPKSRHGEGYHEYDKNGRSPHIPF
jgi:RHS repeat-associated protein